ncbi:hypothetical protein J2X03_003817 [Microbacterium trichothecenolyticum]|uniref:hypothetical protein n=1 Tax=Microbacterium trichothecenolyticum TaxID=69370 RepID=UPI0028576929|nr:hypothetical protein [Microbacterium trichothecenolyticum]MDR7113915.1 hypothetical protein [Microbacterium trichothecenolyticum]
MGVKLSGSLPQDVDANGMYVLHSDLVKHPERRHVVVIVVETDRINQKHDGQGGLRAEPTAAIQHIEPIEDEDDVERILDIVGRVRAERVNSDTLDFEFGVGADPYAKAAFDLRTASGVFVSDGNGGVTGVDE